MKPPTSFRSCGDECRSSYVLIAGLAAAILAAAAIGVELPESHLFVNVIVVVIELVMFGVIAGLVLANCLYRWQERWINYRLLAEVCRKQRLCRRSAGPCRSSGIDRLTIENKS